MDPIRYKVLYAQSFSQLEDQVEDHLKIGWKLYGYLTIGSTELTGMCYHQTVVMYEET